MKMYKIPYTREMYGIIEVNAENLPEAIMKVKKSTRNELKLTNEEEVENSLDMLIEDKIMLVLLNK